MLYNHYMDMRIDKISGLDFATVQKVLSSANITDSQKVQFIKNNSAEIHSIMNSKITGAEFAAMMKTRPLIRFRPLKNSFTKRGDKKLLAMTLEIEPADVDDYVNELTQKLELCNKMDTITVSKSDVEAVKTYVYRHGKKEQVLTFLDYELGHAKDILTLLYKTLQYETGGVADYFYRPIHRLDNNTMVGLYNVVDKNLTKARQNGKISDAHQIDTAKWALVQIYQIQNNQRLRNAVKLYQKLS